MASKTMVVTFEGAEIRKLSAKKVRSLDKEYELILRTADPSIMNLDGFASDVTFTVAVAVEPQ